MAETAKYIGITIGPIFETMSLVSKPSTLWASSYIFSFISKEICRVLVDEKNIPTDSIVTPFYDKASKLSTLIEEGNKKGIGLFHDRIIFEKPESFFLSDITEIKEAVIKTVSKKFNINDEAFLKDYIMIAAAEFEAENPIMGSGRILDSLELSKSFVFREKNNPILNVFTSYSDDDKEDEKVKKQANEAIKKIVKENLKIEDWQLLKGENIKDLGSIARVDSLKMKYNDYFAIVRSDGDNMSKIISSLSSKEDFRSFSGICLNYCYEAAMLVSRYGGVTIYSGGDDLLALLPCRVKTEADVKTVFNFAQELAQLFNEKFDGYIRKINESNNNKDDKDKIPVPSLSTAIYLCYKKFPIYEAVSSSADLLFGTAKSIKDCVAVNLQKNSGQSCGLVIPNGMMTELLTLQSDVLTAKSSIDDKVLLSASQKLSLFETLFNLADASQTENIFINIFDAEFHNNNVFVHEKLPGFYGKIDVKSFFAFDDEGKKDGNRASVLANVLRILKFFTEKGGEKE